MNDFHRPTPEEFDVLVYDQKLGGLQAHELGLVLYHVDEDLREYRKRREGRKPRRELVRRLKRVAKSLGDLEFELYRWRQTINDFLPADTQAGSWDAHVLQCDGSCAQERNSNA
jgi:hypothetical protein